MTLTLRTSVSDKTCGLKDVVNTESLDKPERYSNSKSFMYLKLKIASNVHKAKTEQHNGIV